MGDGLAKQTLLGVTGSGKTFTMANVIEGSQRPAIILVHNKTLAAQLYGEFKEFFPNNAVEYFVSYYDYCQPEAYVPSSDTFIEKDASVNQYIEQMRLSATKTLLQRQDCIVVAMICVKCLIELHYIAFKGLWMRAALYMNLGWGARGFLGLVKAGGF